MKNTYALYHLYRERRKRFEIKIILAWAAINKNKNTINNCIGICLLKMLRNAVYSFAAPFAVEIVIVMIEHYIHTYINIYIYRQTYYVHIYVLHRATRIRIHSYQPSAYTLRTVHRRKIRTISICILLSTLGLCLFTSCYKL